MVEEKETTGRQSKIKGMNEEEVGEGKGVKRESKESGSKIWVLVVLAVSVLISLLFSLRAGGADWWERLTSRNERGELNQTVESEKMRGGGLFGPAVYELE